MKALVNHLVREHLTEIAAKSLLDCHVRGIHSIMLLDTPEHRVRLFVATRYHELHYNNNVTLKTLAAHPHHCSVSLHCVYGQFNNYTYELAEDGPFRPYRYQSAILHGQAGFTPISGPSTAFKAAEMVRSGQSIFLPASTIHSVHVAKGEIAAWFVYEGKEDAEYSPISYSDQPLERAVLIDLYGKMTEAHVLELLRYVDLLDTPASPTTEKKGANHD